MTIDAPLDAVAVTAPANSLLTSPILPTLLRLALPNTIAMVGIALVTVAETSYIGRLGTEPLAAIALVFPFAMLTQMMSAGAMGGGVARRCRGPTHRVLARHDFPVVVSPQRSQQAYAELLDVQVRTRNV